MTRRCKFFFFLGGGACDTCCCSCAQASSPKYHFAKFPRLRSPDDFAKGIIMNKKKVKANQLRYQSSVVSNSITELPVCRARACRRRRAVGVLRGTN